MIKDVSWLVKGHVVTIKYVDTMKIEDVAKSTATALQLINHHDSRGDHLIHIINDMSEVARTYVGMGMMVAKIRPLALSPRLGWYVGHSYQQRSVELLLSVAANFLQFRYRSFANEAATIKFIRELDIIVNHMMG